MSKRKVAPDKSARSLCTCGHMHSAGSDGEPGPCRECACLVWAGLWESYQALADLPCYFVWDAESRGRRCLPCLVVHREPACPACAFGLSVLRALPYVSGRKA